MRKQSYDFWVVLIPLCFAFFTLSFLYLRKSQSDACAADQPDRLAADEKSAGGELVWEAATRPVLSFLLGK